MSTLVTGSKEHAIAEFQRLRKYLLGSDALKKLWLKLSPTEQAKLGGSLRVAHHQIGTAIPVWFHLHPTNTQTRTVVELAVKLFSYPIDEAEWLLRELGELPTDEEEAQRVAIERGDLVILRTSQSVFLDRELQPIEWGRKYMIWDFFLTSCERAKAGQLIDRSCFGDRVYQNVVSDRLNKLGDVPGFPDELIMRYEEAGLQTQRFNYPAHRIHIFDD
ncbi:hypothetical protein KOR42_00810 [Thalassoglobus neptunius]|uniref:Uncharacterized protein n=1 Tax=Thalassoglobus neptunius TaxID=1938619 RepID=A0A5C5X157_9PLAN|nr:hypothetical protein [Thalassoglobus neptunius]TWT56727.1 hypothetical protein KOR42_00810 [Thalassoglobus neptunius]